MARGQYYQDGFEEGKGASYDTDWQEGEMQAAYDQDTLGEVAGLILENWQQMAGTIYYQDRTERQLEQFEEGFYAGFESGVREQLKGGRRKRTLQRGNPGAAWHREQEQRAERQAKREQRAGRSGRYYEGQAGAHALSAHESRKMGLNPAVAYDVFLRGKKIDTVFQSGKSSAEEVKRSLVEHDGYDPDIRVVKQRKKVQKNPVSQADPTAARELLLFIENSEPLYRRMLLPMYANLDRKRKRGTYDREKAVKLFLYLADAGAKLYNQEVMGQKGIPAFLTRATRLLVAQDLRDRYETEERAKPNPRGARTLVGRVFKAERWARRWARGRPIRKVKGGWQILAGRTRTPAQERKHRRTIKNPDIGMTFNTQAKAKRYAAAMQKLGHSVSLVPQQYGTWRVIIHEKKNPIAVYNPPEGKLIYGRLSSLKAVKTGEEKDGTQDLGGYKHSFANNSRVKVYGLPDGSVLLKSAAGKRLWQDR